jgi:hypothetical protein
MKKQTEEYLCSLNRRLEYQGWRTEDEFRRLRDEMRSQRADIHSLNLAMIRSGSGRYLD